MLDSEEAIQAVVNEAGSLATEEALKQFDTQGEAIEIEGKPWRARGRKKSFTKRLMVKFSVRACLSPPRTRKTFCPLEQSARIMGSSTPGLPAGWH